MNNYDSQQANTSFNGSAETTGRARKRRNHPLHALRVVATICVASLLPCVMGVNCTNTFDDANGTINIGAGAGANAAPPAPPATPAAPADSGFVTMTWGNAVENVNGEIDWWLPSGNKVDGVARTGWATQGVESVALSSAVIPDGYHVLGMALYGDGRTADLAFKANILGYNFERIDRLVGPAYRYVALEIMNGQPMVLFNNWFGLNDASSGGLTDRQQIEAQAAWVNGSENVHADISMTLPSGDNVYPLSRWNWDLQGFERLVMAKGVILPDGIYRLHFAFYGDGRTAEVRYQAQFLNGAYRFSTTRQLLGDAHHIIELQLVGGSVIELSNTWNG